MGRLHGDRTFPIVYIALAVSAVAASPAPSHAVGHIPAPQAPTLPATGHTSTLAPGGHGSTHAVNSLSHGGHGLGHGGLGATHGSPGGHGSTASHGAAHHTTLAVGDLEDIVLFAGGLIFFSFLYYMTSRKFVRRKTVRFTWNWISTTLSIFLAVLFWSDWHFNGIMTVKEDMKKAHNTHQSILEVTMMISAGMFFVLVAMYCLVAICFGKCCRTRIASVMAFFTVWSHVVGFALMNNISYTQDYFVYRATNATHDSGHTHALSTQVPMKGQVILTSLVVWVLCNLVAAPLFFGLHRFVMVCIIRPFFEDLIDDVQEDDEIFFVKDPVDTIREHMMEFSSEALALATSYTLMRVICVAITGLLPAVMATSSMTKTIGDQVALWITAFLFGFIAAAYVSCLEYLKEAEKKCWLPPIVLLYVKQFLTFLTAFTSLQAIRWTLYHMWPKHYKHSVFGHTFTGMVVSFLGLSFAAIRSCPCCHHKFAKEILTILAIISAFTWELCLDLLLEHVRDMGKGTNNWYGRHLVFWVNNTLFFMLLPMFVFGIYPKDAFPKAYNERRKKRLRLLNDMDFTGGDDPYSDSGVEYSADHSSENTTDDYE